VSGARSSREEAVEPARGQRCLVTGASGFIGGHLAERLLAEGYRVRCLVRASSDASRLARMGVEIDVGDITSRATLTDAVRGCRYVLHCAALVSDWATTEEITATNVRGTRNLLEACADAGVERVIHFSTTDVYGHPGGAAVAESHTAARFRNWYAQSKLDAEGEVRRAEAEGALAAVILRPATVYGPGSKDVIGEIARAIRAGNMLLIAGGRAVAGLCYVDNLMDVAMLALASDAAPGHAFNVSDGLGVTWRQFTDDLARGLGCRSVRWSLPYRMAEGIGFALEHCYRWVRKRTGLRLAPLLSRQAVQVLGVDQDFSARKAREALGWEPRVGYAEGLRATLAWLESEYLALR
jgi:nucleoside-diphosphate-sugar epimerase